LRENGKKLHSGTHPDLKDPTTTLPYTYLVGVYDIISGISGFVNPNAAFLSVLTTDKSYQDDLATYQVEASFNLNLPGIGSNYPNTGGQILGPSVNTGGTIQTIGLVECSEAHSTQLMHTAGYILAAPDSLGVYPAPARCNVNYGAYTINAQSNIVSLSANVYASNGTVLGSNVVALSNITANTGNITATAGNVNITAGILQLNSSCSGVVSMAVGPNVNRPGGSSYAYRTILTNKVTANSIIIGSARNQTAGQVSIEALVPGTSFQVVTATAYTGDVMWMLINN